MELKGNLLIVHGGGPTAVINSSLYGVLKAATPHKGQYKLLAARNGTGGLLKEDFVDLSHLSSEELELLPQSPGSAIGTSRDPLDKADYAAMVDIFEKHQIHYVLFNGGNGTMDACGKLHQAIQDRGLDIQVMGIPKTMDNDLSVTDHSPGFGSAARYVAQSTKEVVCDVKGLPIHVVVIEASGRNAGWLTAASALADTESGEFSPDLIYLPEVTFSEEKFLSDIKAALKEKTGLVVVVSEGLRDKEGQPIVSPIMTQGRATYFGDVSTHLATLIIKELGYKARGEKPGLLGRASIALNSSVDVEEAKLVGRVAVESVLAGVSGKMVGLKRRDTADYAVETILIDIEAVMLTEKTLPKEFINDTQNGVTQAFIDWCRPLIGEATSQMISFL